MQKIRNKSEYDKLIEKINECLAWYDTKNFDDKIYNLTLDNGDRIKISFNHSTIAHLLGIDTEYLKATGSFKSSSYDILKQISNDSYRLYNMVNNGYLTYDNFISDFAYEKLNGFKSICGIDLYNIEFVCKYSKDSSYVTGYPQLEADYYIAYREDNGLFIIGLKNNGKYYCPMTNRYIDFDNEESMQFLSYLLTKQVITMPTFSSLYFVSTKLYSRNLYLDYNKKIIKIKELEKYSIKYDATIDVSIGYKFILDKLVQKFDSNSNTKFILEKISKYISDRKLVDISEIEIELGEVLSDDILSFIDVYNNSINESIDAALDEHTRSVMAERDRLSEENKRYVEELENLKKELLEAKGLISKLQEENSGYAERETAIKRVLSI